MKSRGEKSRPVPTNESPEKLAHGNFVRSELRVRMRPAASVACARDELRNDRVGYTVTTQRFLVSPLWASIQVMGASVCDAQIAMV